jgi:hypothetical protein
MSQGNGAAAIGVANTTKIPAIGLYVQASTPPPGPESEGPYIGVNGSSYWSYNPVQETDFSATNGFTVPGDSGAATGKAARLVSTGASPMTVAADGLCSVSATGVVTATPTTGIYKTYLAPALVVPAGSFLWVFLV